MNPTPATEGLRVFIYTRPRCRYCVATSRKLQLGGVPVHLVRLDTAPEVLEFAQESGFSQAPVVLGVRGDGTSVWWSGFDEERIAEFIGLAARGPIDYELVEAHDA